MLGLKKIIVLPFIMGLSLLACGQDSVTIGIQDAPLLENIHLHLNKTVFLKGERLWFKAYVQDQIKKLPSRATTNLHVGLFSKEGNSIIKKVFFVNDGVCHGDFKIDSTFVEDSYTLMAWTNYMKNFETARPFLQRITVLGTAEKTTTYSPNGISISVHPEGQQLIPNVFNSVGLFVRDALGNPIKTNAISLVTEDGATIQSNIRTNVLGHGRFGFYAKPGKRYQLKIRDANDQWITEKLDFNSKKGMGLSVDNTGRDIIILKPKLSNAPLNSEKKTRFTLGIFNDNSNSFFQEFSFEEDEIAISVNRDAIPNGINTAVILDEEKRPISQRMFFNQRVFRKNEAVLEVDYCLTENQDSLQLDLLLPKGHSTANLSMSVLPALSTAYTPYNSIKSSFLVQPYLKKHFVNGEYFFGKQLRSIAYELDTRLLIEGTEKFNWHNRFVERVGTSFKMENQIAFSGRVLDSDPKSEKQLSIMSPSLGTIKLLDISSDKRFKGSLALFEGDSVLVSLLNNKGKLRKPKVELYFDDLDKDNFDFSKWLNGINEIGAEPSLLEIDEPLNLTDRTIALDEVVVSENARNSTRFQITTEIEGRIIDKTTINRYRTFANYIRRLGFQIRPNEQQGGISVYVFDPPGLRRVSVIINGMLANPGELMNKPLSSIKTMVYNRFVTPHQAPFISLSLRDDSDGLNGRAQFTSLPIPQGFSRTQSYFSPNYPDFSSLLYQRYGAVWWESQLEVDSEVPKSITVPLNGQKAIKVLIEGMSANGVLYQTEQKCSPYQSN